MHFLIRDQEQVVERRWNAGPAISPPRFQVLDAPPALLRVPRLLLSAQALVFSSAKRGIVCLLWVFCKD